jgi:hypothetical protein
VLKNPSSDEGRLRRGSGRPIEAINEVVRPECARLIQAAERLTKELGEARLALRHISRNLVDPLSDERRQIDRMLATDMASLFPEENGFKSEPSAALAAWRGFAESIARDASTPFPNMTILPNPGPVTSVVKLSMAS